MNIEQHNISGSAPMNLFIQTADLNWFTPAAFMQSIQNSLS